MSESAIKGILDVATDKIRAMVDADTIVGKPVILPNNVTIIPISKISFGFATGGSDLPSKTGAPLFGGGAGAGVSVVPTAFIVVKESDVRLLPVVSKPDSTDKILSAAPDLIDRIADLFKE